MKKITGEEGGTSKTFHKGNVFKQEVTLNHGLFAAKFQ